jgi:predicted metal-dependent hydrolase
LGRPLPAGAEADVHGIDVDAARDGTQTLVVAQDLIDRGFPFAAHEVLEARWKSGPDDERALWQGLAQLAVGLTHRMRGNVSGARTLFARARITLDGCEVADRYNVDVKVLRRWAQIAIDGVADQQKPLRFTEPPSPR